jgi:glc operon protein GlcG
MGALVTLCAAMCRARCPCGAGRAIDGKSAPVASFSLSYSQSVKLIEAGIASSQTRHLSMSFAIVDPAVI